MASPKYKPQDLGHLYSSQKKEQVRAKTLQDKKLLEALKKRLEELLTDPRQAKKAAIILESWINSKKNK